MGWNGMKRDKTYEALICVDMASEDHIDPSLVEQSFHGGLHVVGFFLPPMCGVGVVPWGVDDHQDPWSSAPVNLRQVGRQPLVLIGCWVEISVRPEHDDVHATGNVERVVKVAVGTALLVRHAPPRIVGYERLGVYKGDPLDLVVSLGHHPRTLASQRLHKSAKRVPPWLDEIGVRQVAGHDQGVIGRSLDVLQGRLGPLSLSKVTFSFETSAPN